MKAAQGSLESRGAGLVVVSAPTCPASEDQRVAAAASPGAKAPRSVMIARMSSAGVTSKAG